MLCAYTRILPALSVAGYQLLNLTILWNLCELPERKEIRDDNKLSEHSSRYTFVWFIEQNDARTNLHAVNYSLNTLLAEIAVLHVA